MFKRISSAIRRSPLTILAVVLAAVAVLAMMLPSPVEDILALLFAAIGITVVIIAWTSTLWRRDAGIVRQALMTLAGIVCAAVAVRFLMLLSA